jgi:hypothetical protein
MMKHSALKTSTGTTWTIMYPSTPEEFDVGKAPFMTQDHGDWSVHYSLGCIVCLSATEANPTPCIPHNVMKAFIKVIENWREDYET